jgi:hypothetical protein
MGKAKAKVFDKGQIPPPPAGARKIEGGNFPPLHDFEKNPVLTGTVTEVKTIQVKKRKKMEETRIMYVADDDGVVESVWESAALEKLFDEVKKGEKIWIAFTGMIQIKGRQQPMKGFDAYIIDTPKKAK